MVCRFLRLVGIAAATLLTPVFAGTALEDCLAAPEPPERIACVESRLAAETPREQLDLLATLVESHAATVVQFLERPTPKRVSRENGASRLEAERLDLLGQALMNLNRLPEAADALAAALALDDGTLHIDWQSADEGSIWVHSLDSGNQRLERTARALLLAERVEAARPILARALSLGSEDWAREAWSGMDGKTVPGLDPAPTLLDGMEWRERLPDLAIQLHGGDRRPLRDARGSVLLLDFWASWCKPCVRELPFIESLYQSRRDRGLDVLAINYRESPREALAFVQEMGLTVPVGVMDMALKQALEIESVPTVIVADRAGNIRGRWAGGDVENELTALVDELLDAEDARPVELGRVLLGRGALEVDWVRVSRRDIDGAAFVLAESGPRVAVALARSLTLFDVEGREDRTLSRPQAAGKLRTADLNGDGVEEVLGFRPGNTRVFVFDLVESIITHWEAPHPVFDIEVVAPGGDGAPAVMLGTLEGLWRSDPGGTAATEVEDFGVVSGLRAGGVSGQLTVLESGARLHWLNRDLTVRRSAPVSEDAWNLVTAPGLTGAGAAPARVADTAAGRFLRSGGPQIAFGLNSGQLVIVDAATGESLYRARFQRPIRELAAGDLDGDGLDELLVVHDRHLVLMRATAEGEALD